MLLEPVLAGVRPPRVTLVAGWVPALRTSLVEVEDEERRIWLPETLPAEEERRTVEDWFEEDWLDEDDLRTWLPEFDAPELDEPEERRICGLEPEVEVPELEEPEERRTCGFEDVADWLDEEDLRTWLPELDVPELDEPAERRT